mgnify:CR=1 FL=1
MQNSRLSLILSMILTMMKTEKLTGKNRPLGNPFDTRRSRVKSSLTLQSKLRRISGNSGSSMSGAVVVVIGKGVVIRSSGSQRLQTFSLSSDSLIRSSSKSAADVFMPVFDNSSYWVSLSRGQTLRVYFWKHFFVCFITCTPFAAF